MRFVVLATLDGVRRRCVYETSGEALAAKSALQGAGWFAVMAPEVAR